MNKTFCILPWIHLCVNKDNNVQPCRVWSDEARLGNLSYQTLDQIANSSKMNELRKDMIEGNQRPECRQCYDREMMETQYGTSMRQWFNNRFKNYIPSVTTNTNADGSLRSPFEMKVMYVQYSNLCNMACRSCSDRYSSLWADENKLSSKVINITETNKNSLTSFMERLHEVEFINMAGGETSLIDEHWQILERLKEMGKFNVEILWCTNLSKIEYNKKKLVDYAKIFPRMSIRASIDATFKRAELYRHNTHWPTIERNLKEIYDHGLDVVVVCTVGATNIWHVPDLHRYLIDSKLIRTRRNQFTANMLVFPEHLSAKILPYNFKKLVEKKLTEHQKWLKNLNPQLEQPFLWETMIEFMLKEDHSFMIDKFLEFNLALDKKRNQNLFDTFPELRCLNKPGNTSDK